MRKRVRFVLALLDGLLIVAVLVVGFAAHKEGRFGARGALTASLVANVVRMPSIDQMCAAAGAPLGNALKECQAEENAAGEYVVAWMGFQGFLNNGGIDVDRIKFTAELDETDPLLAANAGPLPGATPEIDPLTGEVTPGSLRSPAQIALYCLASSTDWIMLQSCIAQADASGSLEAALLGDTGDATGGAH